MKPILTAVALLVTAACFLGGCETRLEPYKTMSDLNAAYYKADLVAMGDVVAIQTLEHYQGDQIRSANLGILGTDCVAHERVTFKPFSTIKGAACDGPLEFDYYGPCFHPAKGYKLVDEEPAFIKGDRLKAFLVNRNGQWWLIADDLRTRPGPRTDLNAKIFSGSY